MSSLSERARSSLAYRSGPAFRHLLRWLPPRAASKPAMPLTLLTFCGAGQVFMLQQSLLSLCRSWPALPRLAVVSDGTLGSDASQALSWWPGEKSLRSWTDIPVPPSRLKDSLVRFAGREVMGRKLLAIVASAAAGPTLYCDTDVLWFRCPRRFLDGAEAGETALVMSQDYQPAYDERLVPSRLPHLLQAPYLCAGFLYASGDFLGSCELEELFQYAAEQGVGRTEQTLLAEAAGQLGRRAWPREEVACLEDDRCSLRPTFWGQPWAARHYVGPVRHLFWRDAFALRAAVGRRRS